MKEYSEIALLSLSKGRSSQDSCYVKEVSEKEVPENIKARKLGNVVECFATENNGIVCLFQDNTARLIYLEKLMDKYNEVRHVLKQKELLESVQVGVGGYSISFNGSIEIAVADLKVVGELMPLKASDFYGFIQKNVVDTTKACLMIECTRQNLSYLVKEHRLLENQNTFERSAIEEIVSVIPTGIPEHNIYAYRLKSVKGNIDDTACLIEYVLMNDFNTAWDKNLWGDIYAYGYIRDVADWFVSDKLNHKIGTIYAFLKYRCNHKY